MDPIRQPVNAAARETLRLQSINEDIETQIVELRERQAENIETIENLAGVAEWIIVEPELDQQSEGVIP